jgi:hypothetical protein
MTQVCLEKAPLILTVAEFRYSLPADFDFEVVSKTIPLFEDRYPKSDKLISGGAYINFFLVCPGTAPITTSLPSSA